MYTEMVSCTQKLHDKLWYSSLPVTFTLSLHYLFQFNNKMGSKWWWSYWKLYYFLYIKESFDKERHDEWCNLFNSKISIVWLKNVCHSFFFNSPRIMHSNLCNFLYWPRNLLLCSYCHWQGVSGPRFFIILGITLTTDGSSFPVAGCQETYNWQRVGSTAICNALSLMMCICH